MWTTLMNAIQVWLEIYFLAKETALWKWDNLQQSCKCKQQSQDSAEVEYTFCQNKLLL